MTIIITILKSVEFNLNKFPKACTYYWCVPSHLSPASVAAVLWGSWFVLWTLYHSQWKLLWAAEQTPWFRQLVSLGVLLCSQCPAGQGHCRISVVASSLLEVIYSIYWQSSHPRSCYTPVTPIIVWLQYLLPSSTLFHYQHLRFYPFFVLFTSRQIIGRMQYYC